MLTYSSLEQNQHLIHSIWFIPKILIILLLVAAFNNSKYHGIYYLHKQQVKPRKDGTRQDIWHVTYSIQRKMKADPIIDTTKLQANISRSPWRLKKRPETKFYKVQGKKWLQWSFAYGPQPWPRGTDSASNQKQNPGKLNGHYGSLRPGLKTRQDLHKTKLLSTLSTVEEE